jgi:SAM-dependent methyltransferase
MDVMDGDDWLRDTRTSYDTVAEAYAEYVAGALEGAPMLRAGLGVFAEAVLAGGGGVVADVGCGPGHVAAHLSALGVEVVGVDLSAGMVGVARREYPGIGFAVGSMTRLGIADGALAGVVAFWSLIHVPDESIPGVLAEFRRVSRPGAPVLVGFHLGDTTRLKTQGYGGRPMRVYVHRRPVERMAGWLEDAGFTVTARVVLDLDTDYPGALVFARGNVAHGSAN